MCWYSFKRDDVEKVPAGMRFYRQHGDLVWENRRDAYFLRSTALAKSVDQASILKRVAVRQVTQAFQIKHEQKPLRRHVGIGRACPRAARAGGICIYCDGRCGFRTFVFA